MIAVIAPTGEACDVESGKRWTAVRGLLLNGSSRDSRYVGPVPEVDNVTAPRDEVPSAIGCRPPATAFRVDRFEERTGQ